MIQRIQSLYLFLAALSSAALSFVLPLWRSEQGATYAYQHIPLLILFLLSAGLSLVSIFDFKNRKRQFVTGRINLLMNLFLLAFILFTSVKGQGGMKEALSHTHYSTGAVIPLLVVVLVALANKAIRKDDELVRSADRLR